MYDVFALFSLHSIYTSTFDDIRLYVQRINLISDDGCVRGLITRMC